VVPHHWTKCYRGPRTWMKCFAWDRLGLACVEVVLSFSFLTDTIPHGF